jgi:uncharacterized DUF497 family protein
MVQQWKTFWSGFPLFSDTETEDEIRIISMREANKNEQLLFFRNL